MNRVTSAAHPDKVSKREDLQVKNKEDDKQEQRVGNQHILLEYFRSYRLRPWDTDESSLRHTSVWLYQRR